MIDFAADLAAILGMGDLAQDAVLIPRTGSASALRVIPRGGDLIPDFGQAQVVLGAAMFTTAAAALPRPQAKLASPMPQKRFIRRSRSWRGRGP